MNILSAKQADDIAREVNKSTLIAEATSVIKEIRKAADYGHFRLFYRKYLSYKVEPYLRELGFHVVKMKSQTNLWSISWGQGIPKGYSIASSSIT